MPENDELNNDSSNVTTQATENEVVSEPAINPPTVDAVEDQDANNQPPTDWFVGRVNDDIPYKSYGNGAEFKDRDSYWEKEEVRNAFTSKNDSPEEAENEAKFRFNMAYDDLSKERADMALDEYHRENGASMTYRVGEGMGWILGQEEIDLDKHLSIEKRFARADGATEIDGKVYTKRTRDYRELAATSSKVKIGSVIHDIPNIDDIAEEYQAGNKMGLLSDDAVAMKSMLYNPKYLDENGNMLTHFRYPPELSAGSRGIDYVEGVGKLSYSDDPSKNDFIKHKNDEVVSFYDYGDRDAMDIEAGAFDFVGRTLNNTGVGFKEAFANLQLAALGAVNADDEKINSIMNDLKSWEGGKVTTALETQEAGFWSMDNVMEQALNVAIQLAIGGGAATTAFRGLSALGAAAKAAQFGAKVASTTTMSAMAVSGAYKEAIETGYTKRESGLITMALFGAMLGATQISSIPTAHINKVVGSKAVSNVITSTIAMGDDLVSKGIPNISKIAKMTARVKGKVSSMLKKVEGKPYLAAALEEGVEETTELALEEVVKNVASAYSEVTKDDPTKGKGRYANIFDEGYWDEKAVEAVMSFSMGAVGGVMAKGGGDIWKIFKKTPEGSKRDVEDYADVIMQGKEKEFLESVDKRVKKGKLGPKDYSTEWDPRTKTYKRMDEFAEGENPLSMAEFNRNVILFQFNTVKSMMKKLGSDKAVDKFREDNPEFEGLLGGMSIAKDVKDLTERYVNLLTTEGDAGDNAIITATPTGMTEEESAVWVSEQSKMSGLDEDVIKEVSDIKREIEDIKTGVASEKYLFQGLTMGTIFDPKSDEGKSYAPLGKDFFYNLMKNSDRSASDQELAKEQIIEKIKEASKKAAGLNPDLSNLEESLGDAMSEGDSLLSKEDINKLQKAYDDYKVDEATIKEMSDEIISSGKINEEYDEDKFIAQGSSPKEAKFMSALFRKHFNEKVSNAKTTSELRDIKFGTPTSLQEVNAFFDSNDMDTFMDVIDAIESSEDPASLVDTYYDQIANHEGAEAIFNDGELPMDIINPVIEKHLKLLSDLGNILTTLKNAPQASTDYDISDVSHLLESFRLDNRGKIVGDGNIVTKVNELLSQAKNQTIAGESVYNDEESARQVVLQAKARIAQIDTLFRVVGTDKGRSEQGEANIISNFRARASGILDRDGKSSIEILGVDSSIKGGKFRNLFNKTAVDPLEFSLLNAKDSKLLTPEERAQLEVHEKTLGGMLNARAVLEKVVENANNLVDLAKSNKDVENIEAIRKRDLAAGINESANVILAIIDDLDYTDDPDFKDFIDWFSTVSPSNIDDESLIKGAQMLMKTTETINNEMTDQDRSDIIDSLRENKDISNHHIKDLISNTNVFYNKLSEALSNDNNKVPIAEQINAAALVFSNLVTDLDNETVDKVELAKHPEFANLSNLVIVNGTQGSGKTSVVLGYGVKSAQESKEDTLGKGNAKVLLVSNSEGQVERLVEEAEAAELDIKTVDNKKGLSGEVSNASGYEAIALRDLLAANDNIDDVTTIVFDEIGLNEYKATSTGKPKSIPDSPVMVQILHYISEINKGRGPNNQLKIVGLGDNMQNVHPGGTLLDTEAVLRSAYLTTNHRSNIASLTTTLKNLDSLGRSTGNLSLSTTYGPIQGRDDGLLGGVDYNNNGDPFNNQEVSDNIEKQIELRNNAGGDKFKVGLLLDDLGSFDNNSLMGKLKEKYPDNFVLNTHTEFQGSEADYVIIDINKNKGEETLAYLSRVKTSVGRARFFALISDRSSTLNVSSSKVDTITISIVSDASAAMRPLLKAMYSKDGTSTSSTKPKPTAPNSPTGPTGPNPTGPKPKPATPAAPAPKPTAPKPAAPTSNNTKTFQEALDNLSDSLYADLLYYASEKVKNATYSSNEDREAAVYKDVKDNYPSDYQELLNAHNAKAILLDVNSSREDVISARIVLRYPKYTDYNELSINVYKIIEQMESGYVEKTELTDIVVEEYIYYKENDAKKPLLLPEVTSTLYSKDSTKEADDAMAQMKKNKKDRAKKEKQEKILLGKKVANDDPKDDVKDLLEDLLVKNNKKADAGDSKETATKSMIALDNVVNSTDADQDAKEAMRAIEKAGFITVYGERTGASANKGIEFAVLKEIVGDKDSESGALATKEAKAVAMYPENKKYTYQLAGRIQNGKTDLVVIAKSNETGKYITLGGVYAYNSMDSGTPDIEAFKTAFNKASVKASADKSNNGFFRIDIDQPRQLLSILSPGSIKGEKNRSSLSEFRAINALGSNAKYADKLSSDGVFFSEEIIISTQSYIEIDGVSVENPYAGEAFILYSHDESKISKKAIAAMTKNGLPINDIDGLKGLKGGIGMIRLDSIDSSLNDIYETVSSVTPSEGSKLIEVVTDTYMQERLANAFGHLGSIFVDHNSNNQEMEAVRGMLSNVNGNTFDGKENSIIQEIEAIDSIDAELGQVLYEVMAGMVMDGMLGAKVEGKVVSTKMGERPMVSNDGNNPLTVVELEEGEFHTRFDMSKLFGIVEESVRNKKNISEEQVLKKLDELLSMSQQFNRGIRVKPIIADRFNSSNVTISTAVKFPGIEDKLSIGISSIGLPSIRLRSTDVTAILNEYIEGGNKKTVVPDITPPIEKTVTPFQEITSKIEAATLDTIEDLFTDVNELLDESKITEDQSDSLNDALDAKEKSLEKEEEISTPPSSNIDMADVEGRAINVASRINRSAPFLLEIGDLEKEFTPSQVEGNPNLSKEMEDIKNDIEIFEWSGDDTSSVSNIIADALSNANGILTADAEDVRKRISESLEKEYSIEQLGDLPLTLLTKYHVAKANGEFDLADTIKEEIFKKYFGNSASPNPKLERAGLIKSTPETSMDEVKSNLLEIKEMLNDGDISKEVYDEAFNAIKDRVSNTKKAQKLKTLIANGKANEIDTDKVVYEDLAIIIEDSRQDRIDDGLGEKATSIIEGSWVELENLLSLPEGANNALIPTKEELDSIINNSESRFDAYVGFVADPAKVAVLKENFDKVKQDAIVSVLKARDNMSKNKPVPNTKASVTNLTPEFYIKDNEVTLTESQKTSINNLSDGHKKILAEYLNATSSDSAEIADVYMEFMISLDPSDAENINKYIQEKNQDSHCNG